VFCHSLLSDWNHGNAHFLRGVTSEWIARGEDVRVFEPRDAWSISSLIAEYGEQPLVEFRNAYPLLSSTRYGADLDIDEALDGAGLVIVHEWNDPSLVERIGRHRMQSGCYVLLFHDTHHRSVTEPHSMSRYDLQHYDGVLAFGESVSEVYRRRGWTNRVWTWHEAADVRMFRPTTIDKEGDLVWIGNWGDDERTAELREFLIEPVRDLRLKARIHGVRYPAAATRALAEAGIDYAGWLPNFEAPGVFARYRMTVHVPRRPYATALPGVPTIRVFEALACGIPLVSAPWEDSEHLFTPGEDFLVARDGAEMNSHLRMLLNEPGVGALLAKRGLETILTRHTCAHRVDELTEICDELRSSSSATVGGRVG
jgi:spore maturation protein CgeB